MKKQFLYELAGLLEKYNVALCCTDKKYSTVYFIVEEGHPSDFLEIHTARSHSTGYEIKTIADILGNSRLENHESNPKKESPRRSLPVQAGIDG